jgi:acyl-coenzyme A thioesterase PaaI-like protein
MTYAVQEQACPSREGRWPPARSQCQLEHRTQKWICTFGSDAHSIEQRIVVAENRVHFSARCANTNPHGDIFGDWIMALMDAAASMTAAPYAEHSVVTIAVSNIVFLQPVKVGDAVCCYGESR